MCKDLRNSVTFLELSTSTKRQTCRFHFNPHEKEEVLFFHLYPHSAHPWGLCKGMTYGLSCKSWRHCSEIEHYVTEVKELHNNVMQRKCSPGWLKLVFAEVGNMLQSMGNVKCKDIALESRETKVKFSKQMACYLRIINSIKLNA